MTSPLTPERWDRVAEAFEQAVAAPAGDRVAVLRSSLGDDPLLLREAEEMLGAHFADTPLAVESRLIAAGTTEGSLAPGALVGPYRVIAMIGEGGMGEVYRAERNDGAFERVVALKVVRPGLRSEEFARRFKLERTILSRLTHPGIVTILDGGVADDGRPYLVMQFVDGEPVTAYCTHHALGLPERIRLVHQIAEAVQYAHGRLVVHRDLKPSNILVTGDGGVRLLDFGIAKLLVDEPDSGERTRSMLRLMTPEYAAPEQLRGEPVTTATDVYALGALLFELLTGRRLVQGADRSLSALERLVLEGVPPLPSEAAVGQGWRRRLRGDLDRIVLMALRKEPERRYASAGALADDLERYLAGRPVRAERDTVWYRTRKFAARNRTLVSLGSLVAVLLVALATTSTLQARRIALARDRALQARAEADSVVGMIARFFDRGNPGIDPGGDTLRVRDLLAEGARRVDSLSSAPAVQGRLWQTLGTIQLARGRYEEAVRLLTRAYDRKLVTRDGDSGDVARTYHQLARAIKQFRGNAEALPMFRASVARLSRALGDTAGDVAKARLDLALATADGQERSLLLGGLLRREEGAAVPDSMARASALNAQGGEQIGRGAYAEGLTQLEAALHIVERTVPPEHPARLAVVSNTISAKLLLGDFESADAMARALLRVRRAAVAPDSSGLANTLERWGIVRAHLHDYVESERALRETLAIERRILAPDHGRVDATLRNLAHVIAQTGRVGEAIQLLDSTRTRMLQRPQDIAQAATLLGERAMLYLQQDRRSEARRDVHTSDSVVRLLTPPDSPARADALGRRAVMALADGRPDSAQLFFGAALELYTRRLPATHPTVLGVQCGMGIALLRQSNATGAEQWLVPSCERYAKAGVRLGWLSREGMRAVAQRRR